MIVLRWVVCLFGWDYETAQWRGRGENPNGHPILLCFFPVCIQFLEPFEDAKSFLFVKRKAFVKPLKIQFPEFQSWTSNCCQVFIFHFAMREYVIIFLSFYCIQFPLCFYSDFHIPAIVVSLLELPGIHLKWLWWRSSYLQVLASCNSSSPTSKLVLCYRSYMAVFLPPEFFNPQEMGTFY